MEYFSNHPLITLILISAGITYFLYAKIIKNKNKLFEALSSIDVQLTKRHDLLPNILKIAQKFMEHEKDLIIEVTALRTQASQPYNHNDPNEVKKQLEVANQPQNKVSSLMLNVENYPNLKSDQTMITAQQTFNEVEEQISASRRFYNSAVNNLNNSIQIFPGNLIAKMANVQLMPYFEAAAQDKQPVDANNYFK